VRRFGPNFTNEPSGDSAERCLFHLCSAEREKQWAQEQEQRDQEQRQKVRRVTKENDERVAQEAKWKQDHTYALGTATEMLNALLERNPTISEFVRNNPDKRKVLADYVVSKAKYGLPFDLIWDDGTHHFRKNQ
jgi:hypothetical protein